MYNQPLVAIDTIPFRFKDGTLQVGTVTREHEPYKGEQAIPGLILDGLEKIEHAHYRAIEDKLGVPKEDTFSLRSVGAFDTTDRDPRGPTITICSYITISAENKSDKAEWLSVTNLPELPFDHNSIIETAVSKLRQDLFSDKETTQSLLGDRFTTNEAKKLLEQTGTVVDTSNFTRFLKSFVYLEEGEPERTGKGRPTKTWRFK